MGFDEEYLDEHHECRGAIHGVEQQLTTAHAELDRLRKENGKLRVALVAACTPPWPDWVTPDITGVQSLAAFHLRNAIQAA